MRGAGLRAQLSNQVRSATPTDKVGSCQLFYFNALFLELEFCIIYLRMLSRNEGTATWQSTMDCFALHARNDVYCLFEVWIATVFEHAMTELFYLTLNCVKHGVVPQAATGLSAAREAAERLASHATRFTYKMCARIK